MTPEKIKNACKTKFACLTLIIVGLSVGWAVSSLSGDELPTYLQTVSPPNQKAVRILSEAENNVLALDKAMFPIYNSALDKFKKNLLNERPILLAQFTGKGGAMTLYRPGEKNDLGSLVSDRISTR